MGDAKLTRWDLEPWQVEGFLVIDATESADGQWVKYDEAAALITSLREALETIRTINEKSSSIGAGDFFAIRDAIAKVNPSRKETI
jgi:hypothetical protein